MSAASLNWKLLAFWCIAILLVACIVFYVFNLVGFRTFVSTLTSKIGIPKLNEINLSGVTKLITDNLGSIVSVTIPAVIAGVTYFKYKAELTAKKELLEMQTKLQAEQYNMETSASSKISSLENKLKGYEGDTTADELQKTLSSITGEKDLLTSKIAALTAQNEQLSKMPTQMANELWAKSGGQVITIGEEKFKVIEKAIVNVK